MSKKHQIALAAQLESLPQFYDFIDDICAEAGVDEGTGYDIKLAVSEACANIIQHGYAGMDPGSIILSMQYGREKLVVRLTDFGNPFEPVEPPEPDIDEMVETGEFPGFGIYFIYRSVDEVHYDAAASGNSLTFVKKLTPSDTD